MEARHEEAKNNNVLRKLQESLDSNPDDASLHFNIGVFLWEKGEQEEEKAQEWKEKAAEHFVRSAKLNPLNGDAFRYLGNYYTRVSTDPQRAFKCYQRSVTLNPNDSDSGEALCDLLDQGGKQTLEIAVCTEASEKSPRAFWAFRRLGYLQLHQHKWSEAIQSLQHAIRGYPTCADLWEALGLAYQRFGMFTAAVKSYGRVIELEDSRVFALVESGNIFLMLGSFRKGIEQFQQALKISPKSISAHYGLASGLLGLSKECANLGAFRWGASLLEEASEVAKSASCLAGNASCIWKLYGDIQLAYGKCLPWLEENCNPEIDEEMFSRSILNWKQSCCLSVISARNCYQRALHLAPWQANIYTDIAISSDLICSLRGDGKHNPNCWELPEKMSLGGLLLEGDNNEFWVTLGCVSGHKALKQHAFIRGLQLDVSLAVAWACLGKLYRKEGEEQLARQSFDAARSIDPSLALPWAGMSADTQARDLSVDEAYESCFRAVQILPVAEFQIGLGKLALLSGHLSSSQVLGAIQQAVKRAPYYPESHNLNGLVCEARGDYQSAVASYKLACHAINMSSGSICKSHLRDVSFNLARSLSKAGNAMAAVRECEDLKKEGLLDPQGLQIYAISLWQLGENNLALSMARDLAASISAMEKTSRATSISFICKFLYKISGQESAIKSILKMPTELFQNSKISFVLAAIHALDKSNRLESVVSSSRYFLESHEEIARMFCLIAFGKLLKQGSEHCLGFENAVHHLRKALHMFPNSVLIRNLLGYLLVSSQEGEDAHTASRCCIIDPSSSPNLEGSKTVFEIVGAGAVACFSNGTSNKKFSFSTCRSQCLSRPGTIQQLQKWLHKQPWNHSARYLLILNFLQKAREERFPRHLCTAIERLNFVAISSKLYLKDICCEYQKFQLLLCASEISLRGGDHLGCEDHAKNASMLMLPGCYLFFSHLQLCRVYAVKDDFENLQKEYTKCLELKTDFCIGWLSLKSMGCHYELQNHMSISELNFVESSKERQNPRWMALFNLQQGLISIQNRDFLQAEEFLAHACSLSESESCIFLCHVVEAIYSTLTVQSLLDPLLNSAARFLLSHLLRSDNVINGPGVICMELARQQCDSQYLSHAIKSLMKARDISLIPLPFVPTLLAQAEASRGSKAEWEKNLQLEWFSWSPESRPAELFLQMYLLARYSEAGSKSSSSSMESYQSQRRLVIRAIHLNPSSLRYWKVLQKIIQ